VLFLCVRYYYVLGATGVRTVCHTICVPAISNTSNTQKRVGMIDVDQDKTSLVYYLKHTVGCFLAANMDSNAPTLTQVKTYEKFWDKPQINQMIHEADRRHPKSQTTHDCIDLLTVMIKSDSDIDQIRVFAIMCVLNQGPIFSIVDPHVHTPIKIEITAPPTGNNSKKDDENVGENTAFQREVVDSDFSLQTIEEELTKMLRDE
jgi:hypothetical protein